MNIVFHSLNELHCEFENDQTFTLSGVSEPLLAEPIIDIATEDEVRKVFSLNRDQGIVLTVKSDPTRFLTVALGILKFVLYLTAQTHPRVAHLATRARKHRVRKKNERRAFRICEKEKSNDC